MTATARLQAVLGDLWTADVMAHEGLPGAQLHITQDLRGFYVLSIHDERGATWRQLDIPGALSFLDIDRQIIRLIGEHKQPYNRYPKTTASDELAYFA